MSGTTTAGLATTAFSKRNIFPQHHIRCATFDTGTIHPILVRRVLPGDTWSVKSKSIIRANVPLSPLMWDVDYYTRFYFEPLRLVHENWEAQITGAKNGKDIVLNPGMPPFNGVVPTSSYYESDTMIAEPSSTADHMGLPLDFRGVAIDVSPFKAIAHIWNEWIRDENLQDEIEFPLVDSVQDDLSWWPGGSPFLRVNNLRVNWEKDYKTSSLPFPQKGPDTPLPLGELKLSGTAPVNSSQYMQLLVPQNVSVSNTRVVVIPSGASFAGLPALAQYYYIDSDTRVFLQFYGTNSTNANATAIGSVKDANGNWVQYGTSPVAIANSNWTFPLTGYADLSLGTINYDSYSLPTTSATRQAFTQELLYVINARMGNRYVEHLLAHYGVRASDSRLQRPEYLGGGKSPVLFSEVLQTSEPSADNPLGQLGGHGFSAITDHSFTRTFEEDGWLIGIAYIRPRTGYQQDLHRQFTKLSRPDHYLPLFAHQAQRPVYNYEVDASGDPANMASNPKDGTFGYQDIWDEYRRIENTVHGLFKTTLSFWTWQRIFSNGDNGPVLNSDFIACAPGYRPFSVSNQDPWLCQMFNRTTVIRPMPKEGTPGLIDHY